MPRPSSTVQMDIPTSDAQLARSMPLVSPAFHASTASLAAWASQRASRQSRCSNEAVDKSSIPWHFSELSSWAIPPSRRRRQPLRLRTDSINESRTPESSPIC
ncbi:hypothetical protein CGCSCA4_v004651 [Colletotrichum siamense]|uniref:Uncharacterized protein n=1 Tax=Colletotrichum siamense TaxID=690259 RepID=A0A9P5EXF6_COLSI|nr:hypothetical protein CGCSCA4_v004651 [Colletotrichum siamense]KAF4861435.1 hypothetical protein CGCSCA2_v004417 [Colletotrichum siamense]